MHWINIQIELNIVDKPFEFFFRLVEILIVIVEITVDEKSEKIIEIAEEAIGDEVYSNSLKFSRKSTDINEFDEERV